MAERPAAHGTPTARPVPAPPLGVAVISLAAVAAIAVAARALAGPTVGLAAGALLAVDPLELRQSVTVQSDGPSVAMGVVAVALIATAGRRAPRSATVLI